MKHYSLLIRSLAVCSVVLMLGACDDGSAEEAGEQVDEAIEDVSDAMDDAGNEVEDACEKVKEKVNAEDDDC
ncbi:hypothetical protein [Alteromonas sp. CYL-A6]|uniref:hypothetical protein n=1 Tax=Alteromonas nitratireducens TaxID=3390813 RepID=UPI0034B38FA1